MGTFEILHCKKGKDALLLLFADIVTALYFAYKYLFSTLSNSQSRQYILLKIFYVKRTVHAVHIY